MTITGDMLVADVQALVPGAEGILSTWGLQCFGCGGSAYETIGQGARGHGFSDGDIDELLDDLNAALREAPQKHLELTVTEAAAKALWSIAEREKRTSEALRVTVDGQGGFCLEFEPKDASADRTFGHRSVPDLTVRASDLTLVRLGGSTIDFRDERFKLDLVDEEKTGCGSGCTGGSCSCKKEGEKV